MRVPFAAMLLLGLMLAGCTGERAPAPEPEGPVNIGSQLGLMLVDVEANKVLLLTQKPALAWLSPSASLVTFTDENFAILLNRTSGARQVVPESTWVRIDDDGTGLTLAPGRADVRDIVGATVRNTTALPDAPGQNVSWTTASADYAVLGAEYARQTGPACRSDIFVHAATQMRTAGCHLRVAPDGRAGWTEAAGVRVRETNGTIVNVTGPGSGDRATGAFVAHENPMFTKDGIVMLRLTGGAELTKTEVLSDEGEVVVTVPGPTQLALHDVSADGNFILLTAFARER